MGYQFIIEYKVSKENAVVDALSRCHEEQNIQLRAAISASRYDLLSDMQNENKTCSDL